KGGVIAEQGTHAELLAADGVYRELYETQFRQVIANEQATAETGFDVQTLSSAFDVRPLDSEDLPEVFALARSNRVYYRYLGERPTKANLTALITRLPEGAEPKGKHFVGFFDDEGYLAAVMDLVCGWPSATEAFVGWFMVAADMQRQGIGSQLVADLRAALEAQGFRRVSLQLPERDVEGIAFWEAQGFSLTGERTEGKRGPIVTLAREI
ncbi:MAG: GNAT family N-acetyltransferase, partial [Atopobiaceae bacterium]|nr:GNAT family N-acetyltransferase [Atopobiaceae bacterium]